MKKLFFVLMLSMATVYGMAQHYGQQPPQQNPPAQHQGHNDPHHHGQQPGPGHQPGHNDPHHPGPQPGHHGQQPGPHGPQPGPAPKVIVCANAEQMQMVLQVLEKQPYDDRRMEIAQLCVVLGRFCTNDLARMAGRFTMEDRKVDFLRYAYPYCQDPENYYTLRDVLRFKSDYDKLMDAVQPGRPRY